MTQATVRSAGGRAGRRATWAMRMPGTCVCVGSGRREGCRGASAVPKGRQQVSATEDCLLFISRLLVSPCSSISVPFLLRCYSPLLVWRRGTPCFLVLFCAPLGAVEISAERNRGGDVISPPRDLLLNSLGVACFCRARKVKVLSSSSALRALRL